jgi:hypothetical protein
LLGGEYEQICPRASRADGRSEETLGDGAGRLSRHRQKGAESTSHGWTHAYGCTVGGR